MFLKNPMPFLHWIFIAGSFFLCHEPMFSQAQDAVEHSSNNDRSRPDKTEVATDDDARIFIVGTNSSEANGGKEVVFISRQSIRLPLEKDDTKFQFLTSEQNAVLPLIASTMVGYPGEVKIDDLHSLFQASDYGTNFVRMVLPVSNSVFTFTNPNAGIFSLGKLGSVKIPKPSPREYKFIDGNHAEYLQFDLPDGNAHKIDIRNQHFLVVLEKSRLDTAFKDQPFYEYTFSVFRRLI